MGHRGGSITPRQNPPKPSNFFVSRFALGVAETPHEPRGWFGRSQIGMGHGCGPKGPKIISIIFLKKEKP
jgi:hypothetical protein